MIEHKIKETLQQIATEMGASGVAFNLEKPPKIEFGHWSTNAAMIMAKVLQEPPQILAQEIIKRWPKMAEIEKIEVKGPGFINFYLQETYFVDLLSEIVKRGPNYGQSQYGRKRKVVLEHTNVNPNKAMHIGHLRNAALGSSCERILEFIGYDVEAQYYVDDTGVQVAVTTLGVDEFKEKPQADEKFDHFALRTYVKAMDLIENSPAAQMKQAQIIQSLDKQDGEYVARAKDLATKVVYSNLETMHNYGVEYDLLVWESDILKAGFWLEAYEILKSSSQFEYVDDGEKAGCWVIKGVNGDDKIIIKSDGVVTYTGKDIAYHLWKFDLLGKDFKYCLWPKKIQTKPLYTTSQTGTEKRSLGHADVVVNFVDVRQSYPQQAVKESLLALGFHGQSSHLHHIGYGVVSISPATAKRLGLDTSSGKNSYAMSGRKGIGVLADDLLSIVKEKIDQDYPDSPANTEIAIGAIKYQMLKYNTYSDIVFDYDQAMDINGNSGPYLQYAYARCASVIAKAKKMKIKSSDKVYLNINKDEKIVADKLSQFNYVLHEAAHHYAPSLLCNYLFELAQDYNCFYNNNRILADNILPETKSYRLLLTMATAQVLKNGLMLLGIPTPEKM